MPETVCLALTGASGIAYGFRLLDCLLDSGCRVRLVYSKNALLVARQEMRVNWPADAEGASEFFARRFPGHGGALHIYGNEDWSAPIASGSSVSDAMVVCPCTMGTLAAIAQGLAENLIERAADVTLKERRKLILVPRETPLSMIHLENMLRASKAGAVILPPCPGFYHHPESASDLVDFVVARVLDQLGVPHSLIERWGESHA
ncbi:MAG: UbiX family flavin prenyltransferase [Candidatus Accumulibacter sp.]|jgi:4-hydroxy-3-polyprenylbenzoate decarboxylase|nr:UbiX family flavin prenyltransferase [Accumulibacter sp.]